MTARGTEQTSQMLIIFCLGLLAGYMGVFTSRKCTKGTLMIGTLCSMNVLLQQNVLPTNPGLLKTGNLF